MIGPMGGSGPGWYFKGKHYAAVQDLHEAMNAEMDRLNLQVEEYRKDSEMFQNMAGVFGKELLDLKVVLKQLDTYLPTLILNPEARYELAIPAPIVGALRETINGALEADGAVARLLARLEKETLTQKPKCVHDGGTIQCDHQKPCPDHSCACGRAVAKRGDKCLKCGGFAEKRKEGS